MFPLTFVPVWCFSSCLWHDFEMKPFVCRQLVLQLAYSLQHIPLPKSQLTEHTALEGLVLRAPILSTDGAARSGGSRGLLVRCEGQQKRVAFDLGTPGRRCESPRKHYPLLFNTPFWDPDLGVGRERGGNPSCIFKRLLCTKPTSFKE